MNLNTKINLVFTNPTYGKVNLETTFRFLIENDMDALYENLEEPCTSSSCNNESQNFCDCGGEYDDYEITNIQIL